ncbi:MAG: DUF1206 domain-containing protein [Cyanobacteriota bacterium]|nr:DUF1206 domain-containing protein [Cyanobacteriota bacterium]
MWVEKLARLGYAAKGVVYAIVGVLAVQAAFGSGGRTTNTKGALSAIAAQPFGKLLLILLTIGLIGYVIWSFVQAIKDPEHKGDDAKSLARRLGYGITGLIYAGLAVSAMRLIMGSGGGSGGNSQQDWTARLLSQPFGQWLVGLIGAFVIGLGFYQLYKAYKAKFRKQMKLQEMSPNEETWATRIGRFGEAARGIVFIITGFFLIQAGRHSNPNEVRGLDGALQALAEQPYGPWLLGIVALGLVAYGVHMGVQARYRRIIA